ncbi:hypothetical protein [Bradyrhizobium sp. LMTR 3]|uniref:hypothetical protein n=1 Tax=Bradyrhizobium sp. LMTR 3 TaxID=189873 RepID=UPI0008106C7C|nr:hypothetical protein [Bradyrhizobium sp. LMTR 3]OCK55058.1 hypothetical protein LMTR3_09840 [Bradyrhizobium sp. LMTR 3]
MFILVDKTEEAQPECNVASKKADLEHYAASVLPFGGRHAGASASLADDVPRRLAKNQRLHRDLASGQQRIWSEESVLMMPCLAIPIDGERLEALVGYIVRGLMFHQWGVALGSDCSVEAYSLTQRGEQTFNRFLAMHAAQRASGNNASISGLGQEDASSSRTEATSLRQWISDLPGQEVGLETRETR